MMLTGLTLIIFKCIKQIYVYFFSFLFSLDKVSVEEYKAWLFCIFIYMVVLRLIIVIVFFYKFLDKLIYLHFCLCVLIFFYVLFIYVCMYKLENYNSNLVLSPDYIFFHMSEYRQLHETEELLGKEPEEIEEFSFSDLPEEEQERLTTLVLCISILFIVPPAYLIIEYLFLDDGSDEKNYSWWLL